MNVPAQLTYSHGYFVKFPHTDADIIAHQLFVFVIHTRQQVKHETRKPVGFMQSCCFVFVGILSTYK